MNRLTQICIGILLLILPFRAVGQTSLSKITLYFGKDQAEPIPGEWTKVDRLISEIPPNTTLTVTGHTDAQASSAYNLALSKRRTETVQNYLRAKGIAPELLTISWLGENAPITSDTTDQGRKLNRRVEISWQSMQENAAARNRSEFIFLAEVGLDTVTGDGVTIKIEPNSMLNQKGQQVQGEVRLTFHNYRDRIDQLEAGFSLDFEKEGKWYLYNSAGMFSIHAYQNRDTLTLANGQTIRIEYPLTRTDLDLSFFRYIGIEETWKPEAFLPKVIEAPNETPWTDRGTSTTLPENPGQTVESGQENRSALPTSHTQDTSALSIRNNSDDEEPDSLGIDTLSYSKNLPINPPSKEINCASCGCLPAHTLYALTVPPILPVSETSAIDLYTLFSGYPDPILKEQPFCKRITLEWKPISPNKRAGVIVADMDIHAFPFESLLRWKLTNGRRRRNKLFQAGMQFDDITIVGEPGKRRVNLIFKSGQTTQTFKAKDLASASTNTFGKRGKKLSQETLAFVWKNAAEAAKKTYTNNLSFLKNPPGYSLPCSGLFPPEMRSIRNPKTWLTAQKDSAYAIIYNYILECVPGGCCTGIIIEPRDTLPPTTFLKKIVLIEGGAIPIVLLDDFGVFNWDAIDTLPDPVEQRVVFQDEAGKPIQALKTFMVVGEINGIIRLPYLGKSGTIKYSPAVANHFLLLGPNGEVYYSTDAVFRAALAKGGTPVIIPCTTIPHILGDPPVDLRMVLPFH